MCDQDKLHYPPDTTLSPFTTPTGTRYRSDASTSPGVAQIQLCSHPHHGLDPTADVISLSALAVIRVITIYRHACVSKEVHLTMLAIRVRGWWFQRLIPGAYMLFFVLI